jgi:hypothetical protein
VDTSESISEVAGKFGNVVLEKDGEDHLDRPVRNEEVLHTVQKDRNILHIRTIKRKAKWTGHILHRNCLLIEVKIEGRTEVTGKRGKRRKQLLDDLKEKREYWKLKEALDCTL